MVGISVTFFQANDKIIIGRVQCLNHFHLNKCTPSHTHANTIEPWIIRMESVQLIRLSSMTLFTGQMIIVIIVIKNGSVLHLVQICIAQFLHKLLPTICWIRWYLFILLNNLSTQRTYSHIQTFKTVVCRYTYNNLINICSNWWVYTRMVHWFTNLLPFIVLLLYI